VSAANVLPSTTAIFVGYQEISCSGF